MCLYLVVEHGSIDDLVENVPRSLFDLKNVYSYPVAEHSGRF